jgi:hypothetical protein
VYLLAEGNSLEEVWNKAVEAGIFKGLATDVIDSIKKYFINETGEVIP